MGERFLFGLRYLRRDPMLATKILIYVACSMLPRPMQRYERDIEALKQMHGFHMREAVIGSIALHILLFVAFYAFLSLTYSSGSEEVDENAVPRFLCMPRNMRNR